MDEVDVRTIGAGQREPRAAERSAEAASELGLEAVNGAGGHASKVGKPIVGRGRGNKTNRGRVGTRGTENG